jgi:hypothetical protein
MGVIARVFSTQSNAADLAGVLARSGTPTQRAVSAAWYHARLSDNWGPTLLGGKRGYSHGCYDQPGHG